MGKAKSRGYEKALFKQGMHELEYMYKNAMKLNFTAFLLGVNTSLTTVPLQQTMKVEDRANATSSA